MIENCKTNQIKLSPIINIDETTINEYEKFVCKVINYYYYYNDVHLTIKCQNTHTQTRTTMLNAVDIWIVVLDCLFFVCF